MSSTHAPGNRCSPCWGQSARIPSKARFCPLLPYKDERRLSFGSAPHSFRDIVAVIVVRCGWLRAIPSPNMILSTSNPRNSGVAVANVSERTRTNRKVSLVRLMLIRSLQMTASFPCGALHHPLERTKYRSTIHDHCLPVRCRNMTKVTIVLLAKW